MTCTHEHVSPVSCGCITKHAKGVYTCGATRQCTADGVTVEFSTTAEAEAYANQCATARVSDSNDAVKAKNAAWRKANANPAVRTGQQAAVAPERKNGTVVTEQDVDVEIVPRRESVHIQLRRAQDQVDMLVASLLETQTATNRLMTVMAVYFEHQVPQPKLLTQTETDTLVSEALSGISDAELDALTAPAEVAA